jgi:uncharacterized glyoxalase superfamily protein PhnB/uncharacterized protein YndB with AHSA1/START domain
MANKKKELIIIREFDAPKDIVFKAFSTAEAMAEWWGPVDFHNTVIKFDFRPNGIFHYKMQAPDKLMWGRFIFGKIQEPDLLEFIISFSDENAGLARAPFAPTWPLEVFYTLYFTENNGKTTITLKGFPVNPSDEEYITFVEMQPGAYKGFNATLDQLEYYLNLQFKLRTQLKKATMPRTSTYLNFPGNTEQAFNFYKSVFKTEFNGGGIQRFGEIPPQEGQPPMAEHVKKMVLHVELPLLGGHILMATDAPEEMGFNVNFGNNSYICLEPDSRKETKRLFDALSADGNIIMPLEDMFWGAYYGSCTDKFGVNWMFNYTTGEN